ncbi:MAG: lipoprotein-releasing ABC transporter permease subunit [Gammaproteobacteria bacterium]|nr:lipoprotein-releasing ABC transporter permease subunit [Gammaproteobacteria bacterium]
MFKPLEIFIALRYTRAKRRNHFISFISLISTLGIALGVAALITVLSVMNGFEKELRARILGVVSHATVMGVGDELRDWPMVTAFLGRYPHVMGAAPYVSGEGMLSSGSQVSGTLIRGILPAEEPKVSELGEKMVEGRLTNLRAGEFGVILGKELARNLGVNVGDKVTLLTPQANVTPVGILPRLKRFTVVGIFEVGMYEYDSALALLHLDDAARLMRMREGAVSGVRIKLDDMFAAPRLSARLSNELPAGYMISDWTRQHVNFFRAVQTEKTVMFIILLLIVAVAAFNIVSTLVMVVGDKKADIAILRTLGSTPRSIMVVFMVQGTLLGVAGTLLGGVFGTALALNVENLVPAIERLLRVELWPSDVYYISQLPSEMRAADVIKICTVSFFMSLLATIYPAWRAARTQPAEALRYE